MEEYMKTIDKEKFLSSVYDSFVDELLSYLDMDDLVFEEPLELRCFSDYSVRKVHKYEDGAIMLDFGYTIPYIFFPETDVVLMYEISRAFAAQVRRHL